MAVLVGAKGSAPISTPFLVASSITRQCPDRILSLLPDTEMSDIQRLAKRERLTVGELVRRTLRDAREPAGD